MIGLEIEDDPERRSILRALSRLEGIEPFAFPSLYPFLQERGLLTTSRLAQSGSIGAVEELLRRYYHGEATLQDFQQPFRCLLERGQFTYLAELIQQLEEDEELRGELILAVQDFVFHHREDDLVLEQVKELILEDPELWREAVFSFNQVEDLPFLSRVLQALEEYFDEEDHFALLLSNLTPEFWLGLKELGIVYPLEEALPPQYSLREYLTSAELRDFLEQLQERGYSSPLED